MPHCNQPILSVQDLCLDPPGQPCTPCLCRGVPRVWGQKAGKMLAQTSSSGSCPPACLISSNNWALHQEHILGGPGGLEGWEQPLYHLGSQQFCWMRRGQGGYAQSASEPNLAPPLVFLFDGQTPNHMPKMGKGWISMLETPGCGSGQVMCIKIRQVFNLGIPAQYNMRPMPALLGHPWPKLQQLECEKPANNVASNFGLLRGPLTLDKFWPHSEAHPREINVVLNEIIYISARPRFWVWVQVPIWPDVTARFFLKSQLWAHPGVICRLEGAAGGIGHAGGEFGLLCAPTCRPSTHQISTNGSRGWLAGWQKAGYRSEIGGLTDGSGLTQ
eukprot:1161265-Pelagomonas_calceolata.AAC.6